MIGKSTTVEDADSLLAKMGHFLDWLTAQNPNWVLFIGIALLVVCTVLIYDEIRKSWLANGRPSLNELVAEQAIEPESEPTPIQSEGNVFYGGTVTQTDPPPFNPQYVYVGKIMVGVEKAKDEHVIVFYLTCFNGSGNSIFIHRPKGSILATAISKGSGKDLEQLPTPVLLDESKTENISHGEQFNLSIEQRISKELAEKIVALQMDPMLSFDFEKLDIVIGSHSSSAGLGRLPMWDGVTIRRNAEMVHAGRVMSMRASAGAYAITGG